jgi:hypothetical protein
MAGEGGPVEREQNDSLQPTREEQSKPKAKAPWTEAERHQVKQMVRTLVMFLSVVAFTLLVMVILWNFVL